MMSGIFRSIKKLSHIFITFVENQVKRSFNSIAFFYYNTSIKVKKKNRQEILFKNCDTVLITLVSVKCPITHHSWVIVDGKNSSSPLRLLCFGLCPADLITTQREAFIVSCHWSLVTQDITHSCADFLMSTLSVCLLHIKAEICHIGSLCNW